MPPKETASVESSSSQKVELFGVNDLASDYFQVVVLIKIISVKIFYDLDETFRNVLDFLRKAGT